jgi:hypothetical protein
MEKTGAMMERLQGNENPAFEKPSRAQLEANVKISHNWKTAVASGTFSGHQALHIATLIDFLEKQNAEAIKVFEAESLAHPEWSVKA